MQVFSWVADLRSLRGPALCLALSAACLAAGCGKSSPSGGGNVAGGQAPPDDREAIIRQVRLDMPRAAQVDKRLLQIISMAGSHPGPRDFPSGNLAVLILCLDPSHADSPVRAELEHDVKLAPPHELAAAFRDGPEAGNVSPIQAADIRDVTVEQNGDSAHGVIHVSVPKAIEARVTYHARFQNGKWTVERFSLPAWGAETALKNGRWTLSGAALDDSFSIELPSAPISEAAKPLAGRLTIFVATPNLVAGSGDRLPKTEDDTPATSDPNVQIICGDRKCRLEDEGDVLALLAAALGRLPRDAAVPPISIRADRSLSAGSLNHAVRIFRAIGSMKFMLVVENDDGDLGEVPLESAWGRPKSPSETPRVRVFSRDDGTPVELEIHSIRTSLAENQDPIAELRKLGPVAEIELQFDPRLKVAKLAPILAELQRPSQPADGAKRSVTIDILKFEDSELEITQPSESKTDAATPASRIDGK